MIDRDLITLAHRYTLKPMKSSQRLPGDMVSKIHGSGLVFDTLQEYAPGDDVRALDWPCFARTRQLFVRRYHEEHTNQITLIINGARSMEYGSGRCSKFEQAQRLAWCIGLIALREKYRITFALTGGQRPVLRQSIQNQGQLMACARLCSEHVATQQYVDAGTLFELAQRMGKKTRIFIISDFLEKFSGKYAPLLGSHLIQVIDPLEEQPLYAQVTVNAQRTSTLLADVAHAVQDTIVHNKKIAHKSSCMFESLSTTNYTFSGLSFLTNYR